MKSIVFMRTKQIEMLERPMPEVPNGWALIRVSHAGICGSDVTIFLGAHPRAKAPLILGHEFSGYLEQDIPGIKRGTLVTVDPLLSCGHCRPCSEGNSHVCKTLGLLGIDRDGGMAEYAAVPIPMIVPVPDSVSPKLGAFIEPIAVAVHAVRMSKFLPGSNALIFGAGAIGLALASTLRKSFVSSLTICEPNAARVEHARKLGFNCIRSDDTILTKLTDMTNGDGFDFVYDCAGHQTVADILPDVVKIRGTIEIVAGYKCPPTMNYQKGMFKELSIQFTRVYTLADFHVAAKLAEQTPEFEQIVNYELTPEEAARGFELMTTPSDAVKVMYKFD